jgi:L-threonylcarbamoyladenylate synthase
VLCRGGEIPESGRGVYLEWRTPAAAGRVIRMPDEARSYAARLYGILHELDGEGWDWIAVDEPPDTPEWAGIRDRLRRAAG